MNCNCGGTLEPIWYKEIEYGQYSIPTGRTRIAVSHLTCTYCLKNVCVDGGYRVGAWEYVALANKL